MEKAIREKILSNDIDINNQELFFSHLIKGLIYDINRYLKLRGIEVPHYILNTGDAEMYLEFNGHDSSVEPCQMSGISKLYGTVPRCMVQPKGVNVQLDQLTSPYSRGEFNLTYNDTVYGMSAEFRRLPIKMDIELNYYIDTFTDGLELTQQVLTNWAFIKTFNIQYMGKSIPVSYKIPEAFEATYSVEYSFDSSERKERKMSITLEVETCIPVFDRRTVVENDGLIRMGISNVHSKEQSQRIVE